MLTPEKMNRLQAVKNGRSMADVVAKSTASRGKLNLLMANTWAIERNKALRTNKLTCSMARVDPTLHPFVVQHFLLIKTIEGIFMLYTFLFKGIARRDLSNTRKSIDELPTYTLRKQAESEQQARAFFAPFYVILEGGLVC